MTLDEANELLAKARAEAGDAFDELRLEHCGP
jgi:hypothetical protein